MNFSSDSIKHESKNQNEDFYFDLETPRGHFFAVIDFDTHDFANLNATLKGKLETIVNSFVSISRFSADLFLGFLAKEINNFLHNLREQAGGPQLVASAALCLLSGNRLTYLVFGSVGITIHNSGRSTPLKAGQSAAGNQRLGRKVQEVPLTEEVQTLTLEDDDVALIMTEGVASVVDSQTLLNPLANVSSSDASAIRDTLMQASNAAKNDRTVLVITGPYERYVDPVLSDLSRAVAALETRVDALGKDGPQANVVTVSSPQDDEAIRRMEDRLISRIEVIRDDLRDKAGSIDLLELDEKVKSVVAALAGKADKADLLSVQSDLLKLSVAADVPPEAPRVVTDPIETSPAYESKERDTRWQRPFLMKVAGIVLLLGFGSAFAGAWLQSRLMKRTANTATPVSVSPASPVVTQPSPTPAVEPAPTPAEVAIKPGDSLRKLAQQYNVPEQTIMDLNPTVTKWGAIQVGQKILVPATPAAVTSPETASATSVAPGTVEVVVGPGDSINRFAQRYGTTPERIRELNPQITNWSSIRTGQKVLLPSPPSG